LKADLGFAAVTGSITNSVVSSSTNVVINAGESTSIHALVLAAKVDSTSHAVSISAASLSKDQREAHGKENNEEHELCHCF